MMAKAFLFLFPIILPVLLALSTFTNAQTNDISQTRKTDSKELKRYPEQEWGVGFVVRTAKIPFDTKDDRVTSLVPLLFYDGKQFFLDGMEGGIKLIHWENSRLDFLGRFRFFDIPKNYKNLIQEDTVDFGFRYRYELYDKFFTNAEFMTDDELRWHVNFRIEYEFGYNRFDLSPFTNLRIKSRRFNDYYFGLDQMDVGAGMDFNVGDLFSYTPLKKVYFGYAIHHRSAIFESAAHFARISGGSNYHTLYMQYHF